LTLNNPYAPPEEAVALASQMPRPSRNAWLIVALLVPVALLNYLDRQMLASMRYSVMQSIPSLGEADNPDALWGLMLGQFKWVYAAFSLLGGFVADRYSRRFTLCASLFIWSAVTFWTGRVTTYNELLVARSLMGISEAFYMPAALALIADYHVGATRSRAIGLHQMGIYLGVIAGGFGGYVADHPALGWRFAFLACGVFGMVYAVPLVAALSDPKTATSPHEPTSTPAMTTGSHLVEILRNLLGSPSFLLLVAYFTLPAMAGWVVRDWMPAIIKKEFNLGQGDSGALATVPWQVAAIVGAVVGGVLADSWMRRSIRGRIYTSALGMAMIVPAIFGVGNANSLGIAVAFLVLFGLGWGFFDGNNMPILSQIAAPRLRATGYGIMNFVSISCGGIADWAFGAMRDRNIPLNIIFSVFAGLAVLSAGMVLFIRPRTDLVEKASE
jgi:MFS family permease